MTTISKAELLMNLQDELNVLINNLPNQDEQLNADDYKKGLFDAYSLIVNILNK